MSNAFNFISKKGCKCVAFLGEKEFRDICVGELVGLSTVANRVCVLLVLLLMILEKKVSLALFKAML